VEGECDVVEGVIRCRDARRTSSKSERNGPGDEGASTIWSSLWDSENGSPSGVRMLDKDAGIVAEGDRLLEPACEVLGEGEECHPMADSLSAYIGNPGDGGFVPACASTEVPGEGEERCPMADFLLVCICIGYSESGDGGSFHVGVNGLPNPVRRLASLLR
jgi:hypothetical protein